MALITFGKRHSAGAVLTLVLTCGACGGPSPVTVVQENAFPGGNPAKPIGPTFAAWSAPNAPTWTTFVSDQGIKIVQVSGTITDPAKTAEIRGLFLFPIVRGVAIWNSLAAGSGDPNAAGEPIRQIACPNILTGASVKTCIESPYMLDDPGSLLREQTRLLEESTVGYLAQFAMAVNQDLAPQPFQVAHVSLKIASGPLSGIEANAVPFLSLIAK